MRMLLQLQMVNHHIENPEQTRIELRWDRTNCPVVALKSTIMGPVAAGYLDVNFIVKPTYPTGNK